MRPFWQRDDAKLKFGTEKSREEIERLSKEPKKCQICGGKALYRVGRNLFCADHKQQAIDCRKPVNDYLSTHRKKKVGEK